MSYLLKDVEDCYPIQKTIFLTAPEKRILLTEKFRDYGRTLDERVEWILRHNKIDYKIMPINALETVWVMLDGENYIVTYDCRGVIMLNTMIRAMY